MFAASTTLEHDPSSLVEVTIDTCEPCGDTALGFFTPDLRSTVEPGSFHRYSAASPGIEVLLEKYTNPASTYRTRSP